MANLGSILTYHSAHFVADFPGFALWNHLAGGVVANLGSILTNHSAHFVGNFLGAAFRNHSANLVIAGFGSAFRHHFADTVGASFCAALRHNTANCIRHVSGTTFPSISCAADFLLLTGWNPNFLAEGFGGTLDAFCAAFARGVNALAGARVVCPPATLTDSLFHHRTRDGFGFGFPVTAPDRNRTCVLLWHTDAVLLRSHLLFTDRIVNGVIYLACFRFVYRLAYRVLDGS